MKKCGYLLMGQAAFRPCGKDADFAAEREGSTMYFCEGHTWMLSDMVPAWRISALNPKEKRMCMCGCSRMMAMSLGLKWSAINKESDR